MTDEHTIMPSEIIGNNHTRKGEIKRGWNRNTVNKILQNVTYLRVCIKRKHQKSQLQE